MTSRYLNYFVVVFFVLMAGYFYLEQERLLDLLNQLHQANFTFGKKYFYYCCFVLLAVFLPLPLSGVARILAGILFGFEAGFFITILTMNSFAMLQVFLFRKYRDVFNLKIDLDKLKFIQQRILKDGFEAVIWLRVIFLFPYQITNMTLSFTSLKYRHFFFGSLLGEVPSSLFYTFIGQALQNLKDLSLVREKFWMLFVLAFIYSIIILAVKYRRRLFPWGYKFL